MSIGNPIIPCSSPSYIADITVIGLYNGAPQVKPWFPLHDPPSHKASAGSSASVSRATSAKADDKSIPPRINAEFPAKADEAPHRPDKPGS